MNRREWAQAALGGFAAALVGGKLEPQGLDGYLTANVWDVGPPLTEERMILALAEMYKGSLYACETPTRVYYSRF